MKKTIFIIFILFIAFVSCKKDATVADKPYAYLKILEPVNNNSNGITLQAEIIKEGSDEILDYGFLYGTNANNLSQHSLKGTPIKDGVFSKRYTMEFDPSNTYFVSAYAQHLGLRVVSDVIKFKSSGGTNPIIESISPIEVFRGEMIEIKGKYFSKTGDNEVEINDHYVMIQSSTDSTIKLRVPSNAAFGRVTVKVIADEWRTGTSNALTIIKPEISSIEPLSAYAGDIVKIKGQYLSHDSYSPKVFFKNKAVEIVSISPEELEVIVPGGFYSEELQDYIVDELTLEISNYSETFGTSFTIYNQWSKSNDLNMQPAYLTESVVLNNQAYFVALSTDYYRLLKFDIINQDLDKASDYPGNYDADSKLAIYDDYLYVFKGEWDKTIRRYHFDSDTWDSLGVMPFEFGKPGTLKIGSDFYFILRGKEMYKFSFITHEFEKLNDFPYDSYYFRSMIHYKDKILAITNNHIMEYNLDNDSWSIFANYLDSNYQFSHGTFVFVLNDEIYLFDSFYSSQSAIFKYNIDNNVWTEVARDPWDTYCERTWFVYDNTLNVITSGEGDYWADRSYHYSFSR